jgi:hypothetical protein
MPMSSRSAAGHSMWIAILLGGLIAGTIDVGAAALINGVNPIRILQFIAGGILGKAALAPDPVNPALGLALQWIMSLLIAAVYVFAARRLPLLRRCWIECGVAYGVVVFFVMNYVVVPLSAWRKVPTFTVASFVENMIAMLLFGVIVTYFVRDRAPGARVERA